MASFVIAEHLPFKPDAERDQDADRDCDGHDSEHECSHFRLRYVMTRSSPSAASSLPAGGLTPRTTSEK